MKQKWQRLSLVQRIQIVRYILPIVLIPIVIVYQLQVALRLEATFGHLIHYTAEISFYSLVGPVVTWMTLKWVERRLIEKEQLAHQLASLTAASPDAILTLDNHQKIDSWNQGATALFGYHANEMIGSPLRAHFPEVAALLDQNRTPKHIRTLETSATTKDHRARRVALTYTHLAQDGDQHNISLLIMRDVTTRTERAAIREEERARISRDLHDGVAQTLYFLALKADMAKEQLAASPAQAADSLSEIGQQARTAIRDVRRAIFGLKPLDWVDGDFLEVLKKFSVDFGVEIGVQVHFEVTEIPLIPDWLEPTIFRLVQESLNNVAKHAAATNVFITLGADASQQCLTLKIEDDGAGFDITQVEHGLGHNQMKARIKGFQGKLSIASVLAQGTKIVAQIPLVGRLNDV